MKNWKTFQNERIKFQLSENYENNARTFIICSRCDRCDDLIDSSEQKFA